jgi:hypothetical protein
MLTFHIFYFVEPKFCGCHQKHHKKESGQIAKLAGKGDQNIEGRFFNV